MWKPLYRDALDCRGNKGRSSGRYIPALLRLPGLQAPPPCRSRRESGRTSAKQSGEELIFGLQQLMLKIETPQKGCALRFGKTFNAQKTSFWCLWCLLTKGYEINLFLLFWKIFDLEISLHCFRKQQMSSPYFVKWTVLVIWQTSLKE